MATLRVAVTQAEPEWLDLAGAVKKTCTLIEQAAQGGAKLVAFPECWIPGYPCWIWARPVDFNLGTQYIKNSLRLDSDEMRQIQQAAAHHNIAVMLGFSERDAGNSLYISQALISASGALLMTRRKIKPTHMERTVFGDGSGASLANVVDVPGLGRVGALACWEHTQPLLKYHTYTQHEDIHVAAWPPLDPHPGGPALWSMSKEGCASLAQTYAAEGACFVLHATAVFTEKGIERMGTQAGALFSAPGGGCSAVFGPDGRRLTKEVESTKEEVLFADLEMDKILEAKGFIDVCGHYSRPDLVWLGVDGRDKRVLVQQGEPLQEKRENGVDKTNGVKESEKEASN